MAENATTPSSALTEAMKGAGLTPADLQAAIAAAGGKTGSTAKKTSTKYAPYAQATVFDPTKAQAAITAKYRTLLHRDPTAEELDKLSKSLKKEQQNPKNFIQTTYPVINGVRTAVSTTGLDENQWLTNKIAATPEYKDMQARLNSTNAQAIKSLAAANGVKLNDYQLNTWTEQLAKGEDINNIKTSIRDLAALGQPEPVKKLLSQGVDLESVYSPYKQAMASILEVNPNTITLDDPTLRAAITPEGEMSLYDYQKALRKDPRWQYTNNAKQDVSNTVTQVLKDFGFMG